MGGPRAVELVRELRRLLAQLIPVDATPSFISMRVLEEFDAARAEALVRAKPRP